jgi:hypothetical protein
MINKCDDIFDDLGDLNYGDYDYTDGNPKCSNENAWFWMAVGGRYIPSDYY